MRVALDPSDRSFLIVSGTLLAVFTLAGVLFAPAGIAGPAGIPSTYSTGNEGAKAAYLLLGQLGYREMRWTSPPMELPQKARHVVLILADPFVPPSSEEKTAVQWFVRRGGRVIATGALASNLLNLRGVVEAKQPEATWKQFPAEIPGPISRQAPSILMQAGARWKGGEPEDLAYYGDREGGTVVCFPLGSGTIIWWADSSPLSNYGLAQAANLDVLLNSVGSPKDATILWDEYFHGERAGLWTYLRRTPVVWAMLQAALLALAVLLTYSRRSAPVAAPAAESRLSQMEFVETVGDLYARKRAAAGAVEIALHRFRLLLARRLGRPPEAAAEGSGQILTERFGREGTGLAPVLAQCGAVIRSGITDEAQALKLIQELHDYTRRLLVAGKGD